MRSFTVLLLLNAAWLGAAVYFISQHYKNQLATAVRVEYVTNYVPVSSRAAATVGTNSAGATNDFRWAQLEAEDYRTYIQRLRSIGCPEQTIRDIIIADIDKLFAPRVQSASLQPRDLKYWEPIEQLAWDNPAQRDALTQQRLVDFEKREVIRELLGVDLIGERLKTQGQSDYFGARLQFLPEDKRARVRLVLDHYADAERVIAERQLEEADANAAADLRKVQQEKEAALAQLLTPEEREKYDLWFSPTAMQTRDAVYGMDATEEEFLKVYNLRREFDARHANGAASPEAIKLLHSQLESALGPERYADYVRAQDPDYRSLYATATRFNLAPKLAAELYGFQQIAREQSAQVDADASLTTLQKQAAQRAIKEETDRAFREAMGDKAFRYFARRSGR